MRLIASYCLATAVAAIVSPTLRAQWVTFQDQTSTRLVAAASLGSADVQEKDYAWADFDHDGDVDLVVVRKQPVTTTGRYPNVLLMNEGGVLTDRTTQYASASTVAGSQGMLDATNDRDVVVADVNGDGWEDLVTATTLSQGLAQYIRVPRVYINLGDDLVGNWQGFLFDDALRINDMQAGASWNGEHRFCSVAAGDIDGDGDIDLYFGDYQQGGTRSIDIDDRLLINDGNGYFTEGRNALGLANRFCHFAIDMDRDGDVDLFENRIGFLQNLPSYWYPNLASNLITIDPALGGTLDVDLYASPGRIVSYLIGFARQDAFLPGIGWAALDPALAVPWPQSAIVPQSRSVRSTLSVPSQTSLRGLRLFAQGLDLDPLAGRMHAMNVWPLQIR